MKNRAFTLIELLLVCGIISILMSVVFFRVTEAKKKAEDTHMIAESAQVSRAIFQYKDSNNGFVPKPLTSTGPRTFVEGTDPEYEEALQPLVTGGFLPSIPRSPSGIDYSYTFSEDKLSAVFAANLNYPRSSSASKNSCPLTYNPSAGQVTNAIYPDIDSVSYSFGQGCSYVEPQDVPSTCPHTGQVNDTTVCFLIDSQNALSDKCECGYNSITLTTNTYEDDFDISMCYQYLSFEQSEGGGGNCTQYRSPQTDYFACEISPIDPITPGTVEPTGICTGASDFDHCECL